MPTNEILEVIQSSMPAFATKANIRERPKIASSKPLTQEAVVAQKRPFGYQIGHSKFKSLTHIAGGLKNSVVSNDVHEEIE